MNRSTWIVWSAAFLLAGCGSGGGDNGGGGNSGGGGPPPAICAGNAQLACSLGLSAANIELDPFLATTLSAQLSFTAPEPGTVSLTVQGMGASGVAMTHTFSDSATSFVLPVLGLYPDHQNTVVIDFFADGGDTTQDTLTVTTGSVTTPVIELIQNSLPANDTGLFLFSGQKAAFDQHGVIRWSYEGEAAQFYAQLPNGNLLGTINDAPILYHFPRFAEFTLLGEKVREYTIPNYGHHELVELPWGNFLVASNSALINAIQDGVPEEDVLVEIDADTGLVVQTWDFNQILDPTRPPIPSNSRPDDWLHINSATYDASDDSIIITAQRQSLIAKIDYETQALTWILGAHEQWPVNLQDKLLTPVDSDGDVIDPNSEDFWPYGPHAVLTFGDGRISVFDNGSFRGWYADATVPGDSYSRAVEYQIDEINMEVQIVWQFDAGQGLFTAITGDVDYLDNGNYLVGFAGPSDDTPRVIEVTLAGDVLFEAVSDRTTSEYRVEKIDLYQSD